MKTIDEDTDGEVGEEDPELGFNLLCYVHCTKEGTVSFVHLFGFGVRETNVLNFYIVMRQ